MVKRAENDFLTWASFPSSIKIVNDEETHTFIIFAVNIPVAPGRPVKAEVKAKTVNVLPLVNLGSWMSLMGSPDGVNWRYIGPGFTVPPVPGVMGSKDWDIYKSEMVMPSDIRLLRCHFTCAKGTTWFDDLKIFQDGVLIYSDDFSNWSPVIGAGVGAPIGGVAGYLLKEPLGPMVSEAVGAVLGGALGGGIGLLTGLGIIPVPQIPSLEAAPEGPGAPARLGKYLITG